MPYKSKAQAGYFHEAEKRGEMSAATVKHWDEATKGKKLPERVKKDETVNPVAGLEPLKKKPKAKVMKKSILDDRWNLLKADLNHASSIMDQKEEEPEGGDQFSDNQDAPSAGSPQTGDQYDDNEDADHNVEQEPEGEASDEEGEAPPEQSELPADQADNADNGEAEGEGSQEELMQHLKDMGYSDEEIQQVLEAAGDEDGGEAEEGMDKGEEEPEASDEDGDEQAEEGGLSHPEALSRKFEMELDALKRKQEIELKYLEAELKQKIEHAEQAHKQKIAHADEDAKHRRVQQEQKHKKSMTEKKDTSKPKPKQTVK